MPVEIDGSEYESYGKWLAETHEVYLPDAYRFPVLVTTETTYLVWAEAADPTFAKPGETPEQQTVRELQADGESYELLDRGDKIAVDGTWRIESPDDYFLLDHLRQSECGPRLDGGQFYSDHARALLRERMDGRRAALPPRQPPPSRPAVLTVELPAPGGAS